MLRGVGIDHAARTALPLRRAPAGVLVLVTSVLVCARVSAQASAPVDPLRDAVIVYDAPGKCPSQSDFEARIRSRRQSRAGAPVALRRVEAHVEDAGGRSSASVVITDAAGVATTRRIVAASCGEAVDALALIVALTLDPVEHAATAGATASGQGSADGATSSDGTSGVGTTASANGTAPASDAAGSSAAGSASAAPESSVPGAVPSNAVTGRPWIGVEVSVLGASGLGPGIVPGGEAALAMITMTGLEVRAGARLVKSQTASGASGDATFSWWSGFASLCAGTKVGSPSLVMAVCGTYELGNLSADGSNTRNPASTRNLWQALGPGLRADWVIAGPLTLSAGVDGLVPFKRQRFSIAQDEIYRVPLVAMRFEGGIGLLF